MRSGSVCGSPCGGGAAEEHTHDLDAHFATLQRGITFVVESCGGGLCGFIEVSRRNYAEGCTTSPVAYIEGWYVDEESRRRTLGTRLVQAAEAWASMPTKKMSAP